MNLANIFNSLIQNNAAISGVATIGTIIIAPFVYKIINVLWDFFKPIQEFTEFAKQKAYSFGIKQRAFMDKRIKDEALKKKIIDGIDACQETLHENYMRGLRGQ